MDCKILWSIEAIEDLKGFLDKYNIENNRAFSKSLLNSISRMMKLLRKMPRVHPVWKNDLRIAPLFRLPYTFYYLYNNSDNTIIIIGLLYNRQENTKILER
jgi:hypothetical protein